MESEDLPAAGVLDSKEAAGSHSTVAEVVGSSVWFDSGSRDSVAVGWRLDSVLVAGWETGSRLQSMVD